MSDIIANNSSFKEKLRLISRFLRLSPRRIRENYKFYSDIRSFKKAGGSITHYYPMLRDNTNQAGTATGHYFHQDLLVASFIHDANPQRHIDVGSSVAGFVAHVAAFRQIEVIDIRPLNDTGHERIKFMQADLMSSDGKLNEVTDSLSCLHAIEHFGLGRYGDPIDPNGHLKGFKNLHKLLKPGGTLYISFPIGENSVYFNAHRVFHPSEIIKWSDGLFQVKRFDYVDDAGDIHKNQPISNTPPLIHGCGIYTLSKL